jgi:hypothetical protein
MDLGLIGLVVIAIAWLLQLVSSWKGKKEIKKCFLIVYVIGVLLIIWQGYVNNDTSGTTLNLLSLVLSVMVLLTIIWKKPRAVATKKKKR